MTMTEIKHDRTNRQFTMTVGGAEASLSYNELSSGDLDFYSTFVPPEGRGHGIAKKLVEAGVEYARSQNVKIKPTCSYVALYFDKHKELSELKL